MLHSTSTEMLDLLPIAWLLTLKQSEGWTHFHGPTLLSKTARAAVCFTP